MQHPSRSSAAPRPSAVAAAILVGLFVVAPAATAARADEPRRPDAPARGEGRHNGGFPAGIELSSDQREKLDQLRARFAPAMAELQNRRTTILSDGQKRLRQHIEQRIRSQGLDRQQAATLMETSLNLTPEQKRSLEATEAEAKRLRAEAEAERMALLTDEQRATLRRLAAVRRVERMFQPPDGFTLDETQRAGLEALQEEFGEQLATLTEQQEKLMTPERIAARVKVMQAARAGGMDRQAVAAAVDAALGFSDAEKVEMAETDRSLREVRKKMQDRVLSLLTPEQRQEFEKRSGGGRPGR